MNQLEYIPGMGGQKSIPMDGPSAFVGTADDLRSRKWKYDLGYRGLLNATRTAREVDIDFESDYETADALRRVADADVAARTPGTFLAQGEWKQNAYIVESKPTNIHYGWLSTTLKALLLDGAWWRVVKRSFRPENTIIDKQYITKRGSIVNAVGASDAPLNALTVYGRSIGGKGNPIENIMPKNLFGAPIAGYISGGANTYNQLSGLSGSGGTLFVAEIPSNTTFTISAKLYTGMNRFRISLFDADPRSGESFTTGHFSQLVNISDPTTDQTYTFSSGAFTWVALGLSTSATALKLDAQAQLETGSAATPYVAPGCIGINVDGAITSIDLDGNFLASLPNGTQDVLKVNSAGDVTLEKRVGVVDLGALTYSYGPGYFVSNAQSGIKNSGNIPDLRAENFTAASYIDVTNPNSPKTYVISLRYSGNSSQYCVKTDGSHNINPSGLCYYPLEEPQEIQLGSIDMPMLTNYSNISIAASITAVMLVKYETSPSVFLDYPHDYEYDYLARSAAAQIETSVLTPCDVLLTIYGLCDNPSITIGGNRYQVNCGVPANAYLTIDGREKTITVTLEDGTVVNVFADGVRGSGQGGGEYIFEPIQPGVQAVGWDGSFGFDLGWYEEEGEPPWSQS